MKKVPRKNPELDLIKVFADTSKLKGLTSYSSEDFAAFAEMTHRAVSEGVTAEHRLRGMRAEYLFMNVVASLGHAQLIKREDGDAFHSGPDIEIPDFRLVLKDGNERLVEVKNCAIGKESHTMKFSDSYMQRLRRYAELVKTELYVAIFWEGFWVWTLNRIDAFEPGTTGEKKWSISFGRAILASEMREVGDWFILTHAPLIVRLAFDPEKSDPLVSGQTITATTKGADVLSNDKVLSGKSAYIAMTLIWYGGWVEGERQAHVEDGKLISLDFPVGPNHPDDDEGYKPGELHMMGPVSSIVSRAFLDAAHGTLQPGEDPDLVKPGYMGKDFIPEDWINDEELEIYISKLFVESARPTEPTPPV